MSYFLQPQVGHELDSGRFYVNGDKLLMQGGLVDFEETSSFHFDVVASQFDGDYSVTHYTVNVTDVVEPAPPHDITPTTFTVPEVTGFQQSTVYLGPISATSSIPLAGFFGADDPAHPGELGGIGLASELVPNTTTVIGRIGVPSSMLDFETRTSIHLLVGAQDSLGGRSALVPVTITITNVPEPPSVPPQIQQAATITSTSIAITWTAASGETPITGYTLSRTGAPAVELGGAASGYTFSGLTPSTLYTITIVAHSSSGDSAPTGLNFMTLADDPNTHPIPIGAISASQYVPISPERILDTRPDTRLHFTGAKPTANSTTVMQVTGFAGVPANAKAVMLNIVAVDATKPGFVTAWASGSSRPNASNLNLERTGQTIANGVLAPIGAGGAVSLYTQGGTHYVVDVVGYYVPTDMTVRSGRLAMLLPTRVLDTRPDQQVGYTGPKPAANSTFSLQITGAHGVPAQGVGAVVLNLTVTEAGGPGFVTVWPSGIDRPLASNINTERVGQTIANQVIVPVGPDGKVQLFTSAGTHLIADAVGYFTDETQSYAYWGLYVSLAPVRVLETRPGAGQTNYAGPKPGPHTEIDVIVGMKFGVPIFTASAVTANVTIVDATAPGFVSTWPGGSSQPLASTLNAERAGQIVANAATIGMGNPSAFRIYTDGGSHLIVDISGYYIA